MPRPFWSGHIQISLVSFAVNLFPAVESKSEIRFHQLSRKTGERIHHRKFSGEDGLESSPVDNDDIVKGYEYRKGEYVIVEPAELESLRVPSRRTIAVTQFVNGSELSPELFEKPYFVVPDGDQQTEAFTVICKALQSTRKAALGKIAFGGREHLVAICALPETKDEDSSTSGMMAYTLRYAEELRDAREYFSQVKKTAVDADQLALAKELIQRKAAPFAPEKFHDDYEAALREMVEAKVNRQVLPAEESAPNSGKVINLMDALRKSVQSGASGRDMAPDFVSAEKPTAKKTASSAKKGPRLVTPQSKPKQGRRKSA